MTIRNTLSHILTNDAFLFLRKYKTVCLLKKKQTDQIYCFLVPNKIPPKTRVDKLKAIKPMKRKITEGRIH